MDPDVNKKSVSTTAIKKEKKLWQQEDHSASNSRPAKADTSMHISTNAVACEKFYREEEEGADRSFQNQVPLARSHKFEHDRTASDTLTHSKARRLGRLKHAPSECIGSLQG